MMRPPFRKGPATNLARKWARRVLSEPQAETRFATILTLEELLAIAAECKTKIRIVSTHDYTDYSSIVYDKI